MGSAGLVRLTVMTAGRYGPRHLVVAGWGTFVVCALVLPMGLLFALSEMGVMVLDSSSLLVWGIVTGLELVVGNLIFAAWFAAARRREKGEVQAG